MSTERFDDIFRKSMGDFQSSQSQPDWGAMEQAITQDQNRRKQMVYAKCIEAILFLAIVYSMLYFVQVRGSGQPDLSQQERYAAVQKTTTIPTIINSMKHKSCEVFRETKNNRETIDQEVKLIYAQVDVLPASQVNESQVFEQEFPFDKENVGEIIKESIVIDHVDEQTIVETLPEPVLPKRYRWGAVIASHLDLVAGNDYSLNNRNHISAGVSMAYDISRDWTVEASVLYARQSYTVQPESQFASAYKQRFDLLEIPVSVQRNLYNDNDWRVYAESGLTNSVRLASAVLGEGSDASLVLNSTVDNFVTQGNSYALSAHLGFGAEKRFTNSMSVFVEPSYTMPLIGSHNVEGFGIHSIGLSAGVRTSL